MKFKSKPYKKAFKTWCEDSTMDGLPSIAYASRHLAHFVFWIVLFFGCVGLGLYMVSRNIMDYLSFQVTTTDRVTPYNQLTFPVVTFCNENMFLSPRANEFIRDYFNTTYGLNVNSYQDIVKHFGGSDNAWMEVYWLGYQLSSGVWNETVLKSLGYSPNQMFYSIQFANYSLDPSTDLEWYFDVKYGNCYRFNSNQTFNASRLGYGLYVELFTGLPYNYHKYILESDSVGIKVEIKDANNFSRVYKTISAQPGKYSRISLLKSKSSTLPKPYSDCNSESNLFSSPVFDEMTKRLGIEYDQRLCLDGLIQYKMVKKFGCYLVTYAPWFNTYEPCKNRSVVDASGSNITIDMQDLIDMCPIDCSREKYDFSVASESSPSLIWYKGLLLQAPDYFKPLYGNSTPDFEDVKSSYAAIEIAFDRIAIEEIEEKPMILLPALLSNIGGNLGLFFGPSVLTFTEIFELIFVYITIWWSQRQMSRVNCANVIASAMQNHVSVQLDKITTNVDNQ